MLVIDDEPSIRLLCRVNLELEGYRVLEARNLAEARAALDSEPVGVALLDIHLGLDDGRELLREVRVERPELRVALLSGTATREEIAREHADALISKPFILDDLIGTVAQLSSRSMR